MPSFSIASFESLSPAVSTKLIWYPAIFKATDKISLVVPGISLTMATSLLDRRLSKVLFPEFGGPY